MKASKLLRVLGSFVVLGLGWTLLAATAHATVYTWDASGGTASVQDGSGIWSTSNSNWYNGGDSAWINSGNAAVFGVGTGQANQDTVTLGSAISVTGLTFNNQNYTIAGGGYTLTSNGAITANTSATISAPLTLGTAQTWTTNAGTLTISGIVAGAGNALTVAGAGTLLFTGTGSIGTYTQTAGTMTISGGSLASTPTGSVNLNAAASTTTQLNLISGGTLQFFGSGTDNFRPGYPTSSGTVSVNISGNSALILNQEGEIILGDGGTGIINQSSGLISINGSQFAGFRISNGGTAFYNQSGGTLALNEANSSDDGMDIQPLGTWNFTGGLTEAAYNLKGSGKFNFGGGTLQLNASPTNSQTWTIALTGSGGNSTINTNGFNLSLSNAMSGAGGLIKAGLGTLTLSASSNYSGGNNVLGGVLQLGNNAALGASSGSLTLGGGSLNLAGYSPAVGGLNLSGGTIVNSGASTATLTIGSGGITSNTTSTIGPTVNLSAGQTWYTNIGTLSAGTVSGAQSLTLSGTAAGTIANLGGTGAAPSNLYVTSGSWNVNAGGLATSFLGVYALSGQTATLNYSSGTTTISNYIQVGANGYSGTNLFNINGGNVISQGAYPINLGQQGGTTIMTVSAGSYTENVNGEAFIGNSGGTAALTISGSGLVTFNQPTQQLTVGRSGGTGTLNLNGGTLATGRKITYTAGGGGTINFNGGVLEAIGANNSTWITGMPSAVIKSGGAIIDTNGFSMGIPQNLSHDSTLGATPDGGLTFNGPGALTLGGNNSYSGTTSVNSGTLYVTGADSASPINVASGASLYMNGSTAAPIIVSSAATCYLNGASTSTINVAGGATLSGSGASSSGTATVANGGILDLHQNSGALSLGGLTFTSGGTIDIGALSNYTSSPALNAGALNPSSTAGLVLINANLGSATVASGTYDLASFTGGSVGGAGTSAFTVAVNGIGNRQSPVLLTSGNQLELAVTGNVPYWSGNYADWLSASAWTLQPVNTPTNFQTGDNDVFDNTAASGNVTLNIGNVAPGSVVFSNSGSFAYSVSGSYGITGSATLAVVGGGAVTLATSNSYYGGTTLQSGLLNLANSAALGAGPLTISGGTLDNTSGGSMTLAANNAQNWNSSFVFVGSNPLSTGTGAVTMNASPTVTVNASTLTVGGAISGSGALTKAGAGGLTLSGSSNYTGGTILQAGTLTVNNNAALGSGTFTISGGSIDSSAGGVTLAAIPQAWNADFAFQGTNNLNLGTGAVTLGGNRRVTVNANTLTVGGPIGGSYSLMKSGPGTLVLNGSDSYSGGTTVNGGLLQIGNSLALGSTAAALTVSASADIAGHSPTVGSVALSGGVLLNSGGSSAAMTIGSGGLTSNGASTISAPITLGAGQTWTNNGTLSAGAVGGAQSLILTGAGTGTITAMGGTGTAPTGLVVTGGGIWNVSGNLATGAASPAFNMYTASGGTTTLNYTSGTTTIASYLTLGYGGAGTNILNITGGNIISNGAYAFNLGQLQGTSFVHISAGSYTENVNGELFIGNQGATATLTISGSGLVTVNGGSAQLLTVGRVTGGLGTLYLNGGTLATSREINHNNGGTGYFYFNGGMLEAMGGNNANWIYALPNTYVSTGGALINTNGYNMGISQALLTDPALGYTPDGGVTKLGSGTLSLGGVNTYTGGTTVNGGLLQVANASALGASSGSLTISAGTLDMGGYSLTAGPFTLAGGTLQDGTLTAASYAVQSGLVSANLAGPGVTLDKNTAGLVILSGTNSYNGATTVNSGTLQIGNGGTTGAIAPSDITANGTVAFNRSDNVTFSNALSGTGSVYQIGSGTLALAGNAAGFSGNTVVSAGKLYINSPNGTQAISVAAGATLGGSSSAASALATVANGGAIEAGYSGSGSLTLAGLTFNNAGTIDVSNVGNYISSPAIVVTGSNGLAAYGNGYSMTIALSGAVPVGSGTVELVQYSGAIQGIGFTFPTLNTSGMTGIGARTILTPTGTNAGYIDLNYSQDYPIWTGSGDSTWSTASQSPTNWKLASSGGSANYMSGDTVVFDDIAVSTIVNINAADVTPLSVMFINNTAAYTLQGPHGIAGTTSLVMNGSGSLTIANSNSYSGGTVINAGLLNINNPAALGSGTLTISGGSIGSTAAGITLANNPQTWNGNFAFAGSNNLNLGTGAVTLGGNSQATVTANTLTVGGVISGSNSLTVSGGSGTLLLTASNAYSGGTIVNGGVLQLGNSGAFGAISGNLMVNGGTLDLNGCSPAIGGLSGAGLIDNVSAGGTPTLTVGNNNANSTFTGTLQNTSGSLGVTKIGAGTVALLGANNYSGPTTVNAGMLQVSSGSNMTFSVGSGTLDVVGATPFVNNNPLTLIGAATLASDNSAGATFGGTIAGGTNTLATRGSQPLTLTGAVNLAGLLNVTQAALSISGGSATISNAQVFVDAAAGGTAQLNLVNGGNLTMVGGTYNFRPGWTNNATGTVTVNISDTSSLVLDQEGQVILGDTGTAAMNQTGGLISINGSDFAGFRVGNGGAATYNQSGGTLALNEAAANDDGMHINSGDTWNFTGGLAQMHYFQGAGSFNFGGGTLQLNASPTNSQTWTIALTGSGGNSTINTNSYNLSLANNLGGAGGLIKTGLGTLALGGANSYYGGNSVEGGVLQLGSASALGATTGSLTVNAGELDLNSFSPTAGDLSGAGGTITSSTGPATLAVGTANSTTFGGTIVDGGGQVGLTKNGAGVLTLVGNNTYSGLTTINGGTLAVGNGGSSGAISGSVALNNGSTLLFNSAYGADVDYTSNITGYGALVKQGGNTLTLEGANNFTGSTTVQAGVLLVTSAAALSSNATMNVAGGTVDVSAAGGTVAALAVGALGTLNLSIGNLLTSNGAVGFGGVLNISGSAAASNNLIAYPNVNYNSLDGTFTGVTLNGTTLPTSDLVYGSNELELVLPALGPATWSSSGGGSWAAPGNWTSNSVPSGQGVVAILGTAALTPATVTLDGVQTLGSLTFNNTAGYTLTSGSGGSLTMDNTGGAGDARIVVLSGSHSIDATVTLTVAGSDTAISAVNSGALTIAGNILDGTGNGSAALSFSSSDGTGLLTLSGTNNTFGGGTFVASGTLVLDGAGSLLAGSSLYIGVDNNPGAVFTPPAAAHASANLASVPEPGTLALLAALWTAVACYRFSRRPASHGK